MRRAEIITAVLMAVASILLMIKAMELPIGWNARTGGPAGGFIPFWLSGGMLITSIVIFIRGLRGVTYESKSIAPFMDTPTMKLFAITAGSLGIMLLLIHVIGMYAAIPIFFIFYMRYVGRHSWLTTGLISAGTPVFLFFFFELTMKITLPKGITEPLFYPIYALVY